MNFLGIFPCISRVEEEGGPLVFPGPLQEKLSRWLNGDPDLLQEAEMQKVVQVKSNQQCDDKNFQKILI